MTIHFEATIALGTVLHAIIICLILWLLYRRMMVFLHRIEARQDQLLTSLMKKEP